jgi:hypothetical protein
MGNEIFGISFTDIAAAREAARHINLAGRDVEIYETHSGMVVESSRGVSFNRLPRRAPPYFVITSDSNENPPSLSASGTGEEAKA